MVRIPGIGQLVSIFYLPKKEYPHPVFPVFFCAARSILFMANPESIGNAWAAIGISRVLGTIQRSEFSNQMKNEKKDLINWASEIHSGMYAHLVRPFSRVASEVLKSSYSSSARQVSSGTTSMRTRRSMTDHPPLY